MKDLRCKVCKRLFVYVPKDTKSVVCSKCTMQSSIDSDPELKALMKMWELISKEEAFKIIMLEAALFEELLEKKQNIDIDAVIKRRLMKLKKDKKIMKDALIKQRNKRKVGN